MSLGEERPLLADKLRVPSLSEHLIPRTRLLTLLDAAVSRPLTVVSAPAGYGKTTLLAEWAAYTDRRVAWASLGEGENDLAHFWAYVIEALRPFRSGLGEQGWSAYWAPQRALDETFSIALLNEIGTGDQEFVLVLDNYHAIESEHVHEVMNFWIRHMPPPLHLVLVARSAAHLPLARVRALGRLSEIGARELALTDQEALELFRKLGVSAIRRAEIATLQTKLEGWAAGLQLAALSLQGPVDARKFVADLSGSNRLIADYLTEVVLCRQPPEVREFMLRTSILRRLTAPLCLAVMQQGQSETWRAMLERLERNNLFVVALDDERRWYRYHRAFRDHLQSLLRRTSPDLVPELCGIASTWFEANDWQAEAIQMALVAHDLDSVTRLLEANRELMLERGDIATLSRSIDSLPTALVRSRPGLSLTRAWTLVPSADAEASLQDAERALAEAGAVDRSGSASGGMSCEIAAVRAMLATLHYGPLPLNVQCPGDPKLLPLQGRSLCACCTLRLGLARMLAGDFEGARGAFAEAASPSVAGAHRLLACLAHYYLAFTTATEGKLHEADDVLRKALLIARSASGEELPVAALAHLGLGRLAYEWDDLGAAQEQLEIGLSMSDRWWVRGAVPEAEVILARVLLARGEPERAIQTSLGRQIPIRPSPMAVHMPTYLVRLWLKTHGEEVARLTERVRLALCSEGGFTLEMCHLAGFAVHVLVVQGRFDDAARLLQLLSEVAARRGVTRELIEVSLLRTLLHSGRKDTRRALIALAQALSLAEPEGFVRLFVDEGEPLLRLLRLADLQKIAPEYVDKLIAAFARSETGATVRARPSNGPLTARELEVLRLVAAGLSSREVAEQLVISVRTVKQHLQNIYGELGVHSRLQAVQHAQKLRLL